MINLVETWEEFIAGLEIPGIDINITHDNYPAVSVDVRDVSLVAYIDSEESLSDDVPVLVIRKFWGENRGRDRGPDFGSTEKHRPNKGCSDAATAAASFVGRFRRAYQIFAENIIIVRPLVMRMIGCPKCHRSKKIYESDEELPKICDCD